MSNSIVKFNCLMSFRLTAVLLFLILGTPMAQAAPTTLSCVLLFKDNFTSELEVIFDDADRSAITVDKVRIPTETSKFLETLNFGPSIIEWTWNNKIKYGRYVWTIDRRTGSIKQYMDTSRETGVVGTGSCSKASEAKRF